MSHNATNVPIEAERSVIGGLLLDENAWDRIADGLQGVDFGLECHRVIFQAIRQLIENREPVDAITVTEVLRGQGLIERAGGADYIIYLGTNTPSAASVHRYAEIVREKAMIRALGAKASEITENCQNPGRMSVTELVDYAETAILSVRARQHSNITWLSEVIGHEVAQMDERRRRGGAIPGISLGFTDLDEFLCGVEAGDLLILGGRTSMGKTALAMNVAEAVASKYGPVAVFSLEMPRAQLARRLLAKRAGLSMKMLRSGVLDDEQWRAVREAATELWPLRIALDDTSCDSCTHIAARCRRIKREQGLSLVVIDYLQLMQGVGDTREQEVASVSRGLKALAKDLAIPVLCLAQVNRAVEQRANRRPMLSDLRESGAVEQDADIVIFVYRDEVYNHDSADKGTAELLIEKNRNGPTGVVRLAYFDEFMRFGNCADRAPTTRAKPRGFHA